MEEQDEEEEEEEANEERRRRRRRRRKEQDFLYPVYMVTMLHNTIIIIVYKCTVMHRLYR